jgi:ribA/ribD-fused uncharacterized protein
MKEWHKNWFSNMIPFDDPLKYEDIVYYAPENFYQAMKLPHDDYISRLYISELEPRKAKTKIRKFINIIREDWDEEEKLRIMEIALRHKFRLDTEQGQKLLATNDEEIVEWNNWNDLWWGCDIETGEGRNELGKLLMKIRNSLKFEQLLK